MHTVLMLEDSIDRVKWFGAICESAGIKLLHASSVIDFLRLCAVTDQADVRGLVLDYDLGPGLRDEDGMDGLDLVDSVTGSKSVSVLVWSGNDHLSPKMVVALTKRGFLSVETMPWYTSEKDIVLMLSGWIVGR